MAVIDRPVPSRATSMVARVVVPAIAPALGLAVARPSSWAPSAVVGLAIVVACAVPPNVHADRFAAQRRARRGRLGAQLDAAMSGALRGAVPCAIVVSAIGLAAAVGGGPGARVQAIATICLGLAVLPAAVTSIGLAAAVDRGRRRTPAVYEGVAAVVTLTSATVGDADQVTIAAVFLCTRSVSAVVVAVTSLRPLATEHLDGRMAGWLLTRRDRSRHRRRVELATAAVRSQLGTHAGSAAVELRGVLACSNDMTVALIDRRGVDAVLKLAMSAVADRGVAHHVAIVRSLTGRGCGPEAGTAVVPTIVEDGVVAGRRYVIETALAGRPLVPNDDPRAHVAALDAVHRVHASTMRSVDIEFATVQRWIDPHVSVIERVVRRPEDAAALRRLGGVLADHLMAEVRHLCTTHGDCWPGNVMAVEANPGWTIAGVIDWENGDVAGLPELDLVHYALCLHPGGLMDGVLDSIEGPRRTVAELLRPFDSPVVHPSLDATVVAVLAWLVHVGAGLARSGTFALGPMWRDRHIEPMLDLLGRTDLVERLGASQASLHTERGVAR
jgi:hypothetical protein